MLSSVLYTMKHEAHLEILNPNVILLALNVVGWDRKLQYSGYSTLSIQLPCGSMTQVQIENEIFDKHILPLIEPSSEETENQDTLSG